MYSLYNIPNSIYFRMIIGIALLHNFGFEALCQRRGMSDLEIFSRMTSLGPVAHVSDKGAARYGCTRQDLDCMY